MIVSVLEASLEELGIDAQDCGVRKVVAKQLRLVAQAEGQLPWQPPWRLPPVDHIERLHLLRLFAPADTDESAVIGKSLGHYEIREPLGSGGMGEVYRALDTRLRRDLAIKVLPADMAEEPERLARFEGETRVWFP